MSLPVPLTARLKTAVSDRHVTSELRDLVFRENAIGGFAEATLRLDRPLAVQPGELDYYARCYVYAGSRVVYEGEVQDPGRSVGPDGQIWDIGVMGPAYHTKDQTKPLIYVDKTLSDMRRSDNITPGGSDSVTEDPGIGSGDALVLQFPGGLPLVTNSRVTVRYLRCTEASQKIARVDYAWDAGRTSASLKVELILRTAGGGSDVPRTQTFSTAGDVLAPKEIGTDWTSGRDIAEFRIIWTGGGVTVADDITWASLRDITVVATRYNRTGSELVTAADYSTNTVLASEVVADLLGRLLTMYDGTNATITATSYAIDQLAYPDGVDAGKVLDDLLKLEPGYRWGAYESNAAGKYRFEWKQWPTTVRYEADVTDGYDAPGSAEGLYNAVMVRWRDTKGLIKGTIRTSTVPLLTAAGQTRTGFLDLGDVAGSLAGAQQAGDQFLAEHQYPPNAGRLTVARAILDRATGRMVQPYEIKAGELIRVRGVLPRIDALNASARDGVTVFRIWSKEYSANRASAVLELDSYSASTARALAALRRPEIRRR